MKDKDLTSQAEVETPVKIPDCTDKKDCVEDSNLQEEGKNEAEISIPISELQSETNTISENYTGATQGEVDEKDKEENLNDNETDTDKNNLDNNSEQESINIPSEKDNLIGSSLLMETLTRKNDFSKDADEDDMDEALFDPLLLCPDISMEVDESPVITSNGKFLQLFNVSIVYLMYIIAFIRLKYFSMNCV